MITAIPAPSVRFDAEFGGEGVVIVDHEIGITTFGIRRQGVIRDIYLTRDEADQVLASMMAAESVDEERSVLARTLRTWFGPLDVVRF